MNMIDFKTSDAIAGSMGKVSLHRLKKSELLHRLVEEMAELTEAISAEQGHRLDHTFLGYEHPIYDELADVLLLINELQGPMDFSPQMLADQKLRRLRQPDISCPQV